MHNTQTSNIHTHMCESFAGLWCVMRKYTNILLHNIPERPALLLALFKQDRWHLSFLHLIRISYSKTTVQKFSVSSSFFIDFRITVNSWETSEMFPEELVFVQGHYTTSVRKHLKVFHRTVWWWHMILLLRSAVMSRGTAEHEQKSITRWLWTGSSSGNKHLICVCDSLLVCVVSGFGFWWRGLGLGSSTEGFCHRRYSSSLQSFDRTSAVILNRLFGQRASAHVCSFWLLHWITWTNTNNHKNTDGE